MNIAFRMAKESDAEDLSRLNQAFNGGERIPSSIIKNRLRTQNELVAVALFDEDIVGFACAQYFHSFCYSSAQGEITELYVDEKVRRLGLASSLINLLEKELQNSGVKNVKILTGKDNEGAIETYKKSNYEIDDVITFMKEL